MEQPIKKNNSPSSAGFLVRLLALITDGLIVGLGQGLVNFGFQPPLRNFLSLILSLAYAPLMLYQYQATLGKMALGLKVVSTDGKRLEIFQVLLREWVGKFLSTLVFGLGFLWVIFDKQKQAWHDKIAQTLVVKRQSS